MSRQTTVDSGGTDGRTTTSAGNAQPYLLDDEEILVDARPAWTNWLGMLSVAGLIFIGGLVADGAATAVLGLLVAGGIAGYVAYQRRKVRYVVTDRRVLVVTGISSMATNEAWMVDVRGMQTGATFVERLLGHGHISLSTSILGRGSLLSLANINGMTLGGISNYQEIADVIRQRQSQVKHR